MKRLIFLVTLFAPLMSHANPHDEIITSITESDYDSFMEIYNENNFSRESLRCFEDLANRMIIVRGEWMAMHAFYPEIGKNLFYAISERCSY